MCRCHIILLAVRNCIIIAIIAWIITIRSHFLGVWNTITISISDVDIGRTGVIVPTSTDDSRVSAYRYAKSKVVPFSTVVGKEVQALNIGIGFGSFLTSLIP